MGYTVDKLLNPVEDEILSVMKPQWEELNGMHDGYVAVHTLLVLWRATQTLPHLYEKLSPRDQNIIQWACLLHDVKKLGTPIIEGKDHIHPFKSAIAVLEVFKQIGILDVTGKEQAYTQITRLMTESVQPVPSEYQAEFESGKNYMTLMHSHHNLKEIYEYLWGHKLAPRGSFVDLVFRLVMFH